MEQIRTVEVQVILQVPVLEKEQHPVAVVHQVKVKQEVC